MRFSLAVFAVAASLLISRSQALTAPTIAGCPGLKPRSAPATKANDLRPDDIKVVAALGDSLMAAFGAKGYRNGNIIDISTLFEYRGISYGAGMDDGAITVPNFIKKYSPKLKGGSISQHLVEVCYGPLCPPFQYKPLRDQLNAAQSAGMAMNLDHELDYLIPALKLYPGLDFKNDWKLINIQIGNNDQCASCIDEFIEVLTPRKFGQHVDDAVSRIKKEVPRVLINLIGNFNVTQVYAVSAHQKYCMPFQGSDFIINSVACPCALNAKYRPKIDATAAGYAQELNAIYEKYKVLSTDSFGVIYTPANIDVTSFPIDALSNIDCFHPSVKGHQFVARTLWNTLFTPLEQKPKLLSWTDDAPLYCPTEADRFQ